MTTENVKAPEAEVEAKGEIIEEVKVEAPIAEAKEQTSILNINEEDAPIEKEVELHEGLIGLELLQAEFRDNKTLKKFISEDKLDINKLAKSLVNAESLIGKRIQEADADTLKEIYNKFNVPENADGYEFKELEGKEEFLNAFKELAAKHHLGKEAAENLYNDLLEMDSLQAAKVINEEKAKLEDNIKALKQEFGSAYEERLKYAEKAIQLFGDEKGLRQFLRESGGASNPSMIKFLASVGVKYAKQSMLNSEVQTTFKTTPQEAKEKLQAFKADKGKMKALMNNIDPKHKESVEEYNKLMRLSLGAE